MRARTVLDTPPVAFAAGRMRLTVVLLDEAGWDEVALRAAIAEALRILAPCGVMAHESVLLRVRASIALRDLATPTSRRLAAALRLDAPVLYFVAGTRNRPAFDAEAFGSGNTRTRPELRGSAWITRATRDLPEAIAHELFHVLSDSGAHSDDAANLMHEDTAPGRRRLEPEQCRAMLEEARKNNLLRAD